MSSRRTIPALACLMIALSANFATQAGDGVEITPDGPNLTVAIDGEPFTVYRVDAGPKPILYPLLGADGLAYTRSYPLEEKEGEDRDHPHQKSFWFTYGSVNGSDFWAEGKGHGSIKETSRKVEGDGRISKSIHTTNDWLDADGKTILEDERTLTFWNTEGRRIIDVDVTLRASEGPIEFGDTKEGMFGLRVASSMDVKAKEGGRITNAEGRTDGDAWGKRSAWVDYSGPVAGRTVGVTILEFPDSYGHPTAWHVRDYGLFAANPLGKHDFGLAGEPTPTTMEAGKAMRFHYRVVLHPGDVEAADPKSEYERLGQPPKTSR